MRAEVTRRIKALGRQNRPREAVEQLAEMAKLGVQPDTLAATTLLDACARCGKLDMMQAVFDELFGNGGWAGGWVAGGWVGERSCSA